MANTYKDIVITPFRGDANNNPVIKFSSGDASTNTDMNVRFYATSNGTLSFEGTAGQLFSITNDLSGTIFAVNDISGIPSIEVDANGKISLAHFGGNVGIGTSNAQYKLDVSGDMRVTGNVILGDASTDTITLNGSTISLGNNQSIDAGTLFIDATNNEVGIGTTNPTSNLHVIGTANITSFLFVNTTNVAPTIEAAFSQANTSRTHANAAHLTANAAFDQANTARSHANASFTQANTARTHANTAHETANAAFNQANTARTHANTAHLTANAAFDQANTARTHANTAHLTANAAFDQANTARTHANTAFATANSKFSSNGGTITGNVAITGSLTVSGNSYTLDTETLRVGDPLIYLAGNNYTSDIVDIGFVANYNDGSANLHTGFFRDATTKEYYLFEGYNKEPEPNHIDVTGNNFTISTLNTNIKTSNLSLGGVNAIGWIRESYNQANTARTHANAAHETANAGFNQANTARTHANTAHETANAAFNQANTARTHANTAHLTANAAFDQANTARTHANLAFEKANSANLLAYNALANTTGTLEGNLTIKSTLTTTSNVVTFGTAFKIEANGDVFIFGTLNMLN